MHTLATDIWTKHPETRIDWCRNTCIDYFLCGGLQRIHDKCERRRHYEMNRSDRDSDMTHDATVWSPSSDTLMLSRSAPALSHFDGRSPTTRMRKPLLASPSNGSDGVRTLPMPNRSAGLQKLGLELHCSAAAKLHVSNSSLSQGSSVGGGSSAESDHLMFGLSDIGAESNSGDLKNGQDGDGKQPLWTYNTMLV